MADLVDGAVGIRWRTTQVRNSVRDQNTVIELLARIKQSDAGMAHLWDIRPLAGGDHQCASVVHDAIRLFQTHWVSKKELTSADGVVDQSGPTLRLMNRLAIGAPRATGVVDEPVFVDVIVGNVPFGHRPESASEVTLKAFIQRRVVTPGYRAKNRELVVFAVLSYDGFNVGQQIKEIAAAVGPGARLGKVCLYGVSRGGLLTIKLARVAPLLGAPLTYVGVSEAAFFHEDATYPPTGMLPAGAPVAPSIKAEFSSFNARRKVDAFQHRGNIIKLTKKHYPPYIWSSLMDAGEIHGAINGFHEHLDLTPRITETQSNNAHVQGARLGEDIILQHIQQILIQA